MQTSKPPSPARSQGALLTPRRYLTRSSRSVCSPSHLNVSGRLTSIIEDYNNLDSFALSPLTNRKAVLNDITNIEEPRRASWWKKLNENSRDVTEVINAHEEMDVNNVIEEYVDVLSQEKKNYTLDLPASSDNSIVIPQKKLFSQKDVQPQKKFKEISVNRETLAKINKTNNDLHDKSVKVTTKNLFGHGTKRSRPVFPVALLNLSHNKTAANKTKELVTVDVKGQVKSLFNNRPGVKSKNMFVDFIVSEGEDEIPEIEPKIFAFHEIKNSTYKEKSEAKQKETYVQVFEDILERSTRSMNKSNNKSMVKKFNRSEKVKNNSNSSQGIISHEKYDEITEETAASDSKTHVDNDTQKLISGNEDTKLLHQQNYNFEQTEKKKTLNVLDQSQKLKNSFQKVNKANKTKELVTVDVKGQVKSLFKNRPGVKSKNMFVDFIVSESEDEIPEIEPKIFAFPKKPKSFRRPSSSSRASSVTTSIEMEDWNMLPSSTTVDYQLEGNGDEKFNELHENEELHLHYEEEPENNPKIETTLVEKHNKNTEHEIKNSTYKEKSEAKQKKAYVQVFEDILERSTRSMNKSNNKSMVKKLNRSEKVKNNSKSSQGIISHEKYDEITEETAASDSKTHVDNDTQKLISGNEDTKFLHQQNYNLEQTEKKKTLNVLDQSQKLKNSFQKVNKANKTKELVTVDVKGQVKSLFKNRPGVKSKNMFVDFIVSESEDEIPEIEHKIFAFPKKPKSFRRPSSSSRASSVTTSIEIEDWNMLPSSTMVDYQLEGNGDEKFNELHENEELHLHYEEEPENNPEIETTLVEKHNKNTEHEIKNSTYREQSEAKQKKAYVQVFEDILERSTRSMNKSNNKSMVKKLNRSEKVKNNSKSSQGIISHEKYDEITEETAASDSKTHVDNDTQKLISGNEDTKLLHQQNYNFEQTEKKKTLNVLDQSQKLKNSLQKVNNSKSVNNSEQIVINKSKHGQEQEYSRRDTENLEQNDQSVKKSFVIKKQKVVEETQEEIDDSNSVNSVIIDDKISNASINVQSKQDFVKLADQNKSETESAKLSTLEINIESKKNTTASDENMQDEEQNQMQVEDILQDNDSHEEIEQSRDENEQEESMQEKHGESKENYLEVEDENVSEVEEHSDLEQENNSDVGEQKDPEDEINDSDVETKDPEEEENVLDGKEQEGPEEENDSEVEKENDLEEEEQNETEEQYESEEDSVQEQDSLPQEYDQEAADQTDKQIENNDDEQNQSELNEDEQANTYVKNYPESDIENQEQNESITNLTHDTTSRNRNKYKDQSPEAVLQRNADLGETFMSNGRNTNIRKTKSTIKNLNIKPSLASVSESIDFSDGTRNSSAEGSSWDSHRTTRKTIRQTLGKDFSPRKSLRALVMEKSAKRFTTGSILNDELSKLPQANSTEFPDAEFEESDVNNDTEEPEHEISKRTKQASLEMYLQSIKRKNMQNRLQMEEAVLNLFKNTAETPTYFKKPPKPGLALPKANTKSQKKQPKSKVIKSTIIPLEHLPDHFLEDLKYKPPKRFKPGNAAWITKRLYTFLESKLEPKYDYRARVRAERLVENIYNFTKDTRRLSVAPQHAVDVLKREMAKLQIVHTHFDFYNFFHDYMPREIRIKVVPDIVNELPLPKNGVFSDIL